MCEARDKNNRDFTTKNGTTLYNLINNRMRAWIVAFEAWSTCSPEELSASSLWQE